MPGPKSNPQGGKTRFDKASGKWQRRLENRRSNVIRNAGGKQFGSKNR